MRFFVFILSCFFSLVLQGQAFTHPVPAPDTSCIQEEKAIHISSTANDHAPYDPTMEELIATSIYSLRRTGRFGQLINKQTHL